jgi:hypoxanthine phosphoribosyltransferase
MHSIDFIEVQRLLNEVCASIDESKFLPDRVVALSPNGIVCGKMLSEYFDIPLTCVSWSDDEDERESNCWLPEDARDGHQMLIVMDIADDATLTSFCDDWDSSVHTDEWMENIRFVSLIESTDSILKMDYKGLEIDNVQDIRLPWKQWWV